ncbi:transposase [Mesorhizobium sp. M1005]|uniref:IS110 family transposase n=1 Tax=unclassified Mesorhizobium TaxID=325217 RepID=UPI003337C8B3
MSRLIGASSAAWLKPHALRRDLTMYHCGLDISSRETAICIVHAEGKICKEKKVASEPEAIAQAILESGYACKKIGLEAGSTAAWLQAGLVAHELPAICIDARHAAAMLHAGLRNKSDRNDTRGIAHLMRMNAYRPVGVKSEYAQRLGALFTARNTLQDQLIRIENVIRGLLRCDGISLLFGRRHFEKEVRERIGDHATVMLTIEPLLVARAELLRQRAVFDRRIISLARRDEVCKLLMTMPGGVGAHVALSFRASVDDPARSVVCGGAFRSYAAQIQLR